MPNTNPDLVRLRNNMRIGANALRRDIVKFTEVAPMHWGAHPEEVNRLKWWCEQLLKQLSGDAMTDSDLVPGCEQLGLFANHPAFPERPRNGYVKR